MVSRLAGEAIPVLREYQRNTTGSHEIPHTVHTGPLQAGAALTGVLYLLEDFEAFSGSIGPQSFDLLGQRVAGACLLVRTDTGVEDGTARTVAISIGHDYVLMS